MSGDYSRFTDRPRRRYSGVLMQQGRVQLDADWNEHVDIVQRRWEVQAEDTFGPAAVPRATTPDGFKISAGAPGSNDLAIAAGRIYVDGKLAELFPDEQVGGKPVSYLSQPFYPVPPALPTGAAMNVFLDVWDREVTYIEDPEILEKALGGPDTTTRRQTVWQVRWQAPEDGKTAACGAAPPPASGGRLSTQAVAPPPSDDPCDLAPSGGYRGLENRLYRLEVHTGGTLAATRFKWSRDNASVVSAVTAIGGSASASQLTVNRIGRDAVLRFAKDNWVEVTDDVRELMGEPGEMAKVASVDEAARTITLDRKIPSPGGRAFGATAQDLADRHTRVRLWSQSTPRNTLDANGLMAQTPGSWIELEDGVQIQLSGTDKLQTGDYWVFAARAVDGSVEALDKAEPRGIRHHYCQLAAIDAAGSVHDCRPLWPSEGRCCCCTLEVGEGGDFPSLEEALASLKGRQARDPVVICLLPGTHSLRDTAVVDQDRVTIQGCGPLTEVIGPDGKPAFAISGRSDRLEDLLVTAAAGMPAVVSDGATDLEITGNLFRHDTRRSQGTTESGLVLLEVGTIGARIAGNEIAHGDGHGIAIAIGFHQDIVIAGNEIRGMAGCGISSVQSSAAREAQRDRLRTRALEMFREHLSSQQESEIRKVIDVSRASRPSRGLRSPRNADGLRIEHNTIAGCVRLSDKTQERDSELPYGGIVLVRVAHVQITDNRIQENGTVKSGVPVAGIYVNQCRGLIIRDNVVVDNGPAPDEDQPIPGLQGGILGLQLSVEIEQIDILAGKGEQLAPLQPDGWPAASIQSNLVVAPRGLALLLVGMGPMQVTGNRLTSRDVLGTPRGDADPKPSTTAGDVLFKLVRYFGTVVILNAGWPAYMARQILPWVDLLAKAKTPTSGAPASNVSETLNLGAATASNTEPFIVGGKVDFSDNQVQLDLARGEIEFAIAAMGLFTGDDLALQDNQTECTLFVDLLFSDTLAVATTLRATGNGFTESVFFCMLSLFAVGVLMCTATSNQGTHCINAYALDHPFAWLISRDNANLFGPQPTAQDPDRQTCGKLVLPGLKGPASDFAN